MNPKNTVKLNLHDPRAYVIYWMATRNHTVRAIKNNPNAFFTLCLDYAAERRKALAKNPDTKIPKLSNSDLEFAFQEYIGIQTEMELAVALDAYKCNSENLEPIKAWVQAVTGQCLETDLAVISHWCWMVKRKAYNLPVKHQIMPVIFGKQGGGKTQAIEHLIRPIETYRLAIGMHQLSDDRVFEGLANNFVVVFDELQGIDRLDMNVLKKQITTNYNSSRKLYTHIIVNSPMRASFIGATNRPVAHSFNDSTGMRRFWELTAVDKLDWATINAIDYTELWCGINEANEEGYLTGTVLTTVLETQQKTLVNKEELEEFVLDYALMPKNANDVKEISADRLYQEYSLWAGRNGVTKKFNSIWFNRHLKHILANEMQPNESAVLKRVYKVSVQSPIDVALSIVTGGKK